MSCPKNVLFFPELLELADYASSNNLIFFTSRNVRNLLPYHFQTFPFVVKEVHALFELRKVYFQHIVGGLIGVYEDARIVVYPDNTTRGKAFNRQRAVGWVRIGFK